MAGALTSSLGVYDDYVPPPGGDDSDVSFFPPDIGDYQPTGGMPTPPVPGAGNGVLSNPNAGVGDGGGDDTWDNTQQGVLAAQNPQVQMQMNAIQQARQRIDAYRAQQDAAKSGQINLPLLAAAGAMLSPTRSGSFGESIGNAFSAAAPAVARQRQTDAAEEAARAKQDWNMSYQEALLGDKSAGRSIQQQRLSLDDRIKSRTLELKAQGLDDTAAYRQARIELGQGQLGINQQNANTRGNTAANQVTTNANVQAQAEIDAENAKRAESGQEPMSEAEMAAARTRFITSGAQGLKTSGAGGSTAILTQQAMTKAREAITSQNAERVAQGKPPLTPGEEAEINISQIKDAKSATPTASAKSQIMSMAIAAADDDIARMDNPTEEQKREARIKRIGEYTKRTSVYGQTTNALKRDVMDNWIAADPTIVSDPARFAILQSKVNGGFIIKPPQALAIEDRGQQTATALNALRRVREGVSQAYASAGAMGKPFRAGETLQNILLQSPQTVRADIESNLALARDLIPTIIRNKGPHPQGAHATAELEKIIRGGNWGDTYQNVMSSSESMMKVLGSDLRNLNDFYKNGLGRDLAVFGGNPQQPPFSPPQGGGSGGGGGNPGAPPPAVARPAPQSAPARQAPSNSPPVDRLQEGANTTFGNGQVWTLRNGQPVRVQ